MGESKRPSRLRRALFDRPILKLFLVLLFIVSCLQRWLRMHDRCRCSGYLLALLVAIIAMVYAIVLIGHIVSLYLIRKPLDRLFSARDIFSLLLSYVMFIVGILLVISLLLRRG